MPMESLRYLRKNNNQNERELESNYWYEDIKIHSILCEYYVNAYSLSGHDYLYGEEPTLTYSPTAQMLICCDINNDSSILAKFGIQSDSDMTAAIHISAFRETFGRMDNTISPYFSGAWYEPKAGDVIRVIEWGLDRPGADSGASWTYPEPDNIKTEADAPQTPGGHPSWEAWKRGGMLFEVTQRVDEDFKLINRLGGHYVWFLKCKRFDYSHETGLQPEDGSNIPIDPRNGGKLPGGTPVITPNKIYDQNIEDSSKKLFNYPDPGDGKARDDSVYGSYGK